MTTKSPRQQCKKCPWRKGVDPHDIPNGYNVALHEKLDGTIAVEGDFCPGRPMKLMACHETSIERPLPCVGWLHNQLGEGNNIALRLAVIRGQVDSNVKVIGPQHERFEDTLPSDSQRKKR